MTPEYINENITLYQNEGSLAYGTDAFLLSAFMRRHSRERAAEFCAGSGVISLLAMAKGKFSHVTAFEIQKNIADLAEKNVEINGFSEKIDVCHTDIRELPHTYNGAFGAVFSNPPYMTATSGKLNQNHADSASRHEINGNITDFAASASKLLKYGGVFYVVYRPDRLSELLCACSQNRLEPKRMTLVYPTAGHEPSILLMEAKKGGADGIFCTRPLIIYKDNTRFSDDNYTEEMKYIYEHGDFNEFYKKP